MIKPTYSISWEQSQANMQGKGIDWGDSVANLHRQCDSLQAIVSHPPKNAIVHVDSKIGGISIGTLLLVIFIIWILK